MNILITGCNGQLGNEMQLLEKENPQHTYYNTDTSWLLNSLWQTIRLMVL